MRHSSGVLVAIALGLALMALVASSEAAQRRREQLGEELIPLERALERTQADVYLLAAETRAYLVAGNASVFRARATDAQASLDANIIILGSLAAPSEFAPQIAEVMRLARQYDASATEALGFGDVGNLEGARENVSERGGPTLNEFADRASALDTQLVAEHERLTADVRSIERIQRTALVFAGGLGLVVVAVLAAASGQSRRLAEALHVEYARTAAIIDGLPGVVWEARGPANASEQHFQFVSDYAETLLGYSAREWLATPRFGTSIVHPEDRARLAAEATAILASGKPGASEFRWLAADGRVLSVRAFLRGIVDEGGQLVGTRGVTVDITEQKEAEAALETERARFATMVATLPYGICAIDSTGRVEYLNVTGARLLGCTVDEVVSTQFHELVHITPESALHPELACVADRVLGEGTALELRDTLARRNGTTFLADVVAAPIRTRGRVSGAVLAFQDATERHQLEQLKDDYLAFASHELRSPLTAVSALAQYLDRRAAKEDSPFDEDSREAIEALARDTQRMVRMTEVFLDLARIESGRFAVESERVDLASMVREEAEAAGRAAPHMQLEVAADVPISSWTDEVRVRQVVRNLLENAARHAGPSPHVRLTLTVEDTRARLEVADDGPGIDPQHQAHIFERLYRAGAPHAPGGLGAGLFITTEIVNRLGGTIGVRSTPGEGATFTVYLPLITQE